MQVNKVTMPFLLAFLRNSYTCTGPARYVWSFFQYKPVGHHFGTHSMIFKVKIDWLSLLRLPLPISTLSPYSKLNLHRKSENPSLPHHVAYTYTIYNIEVNPYFRENTVIITSKKTGNLSPCSIASSALQTLFCLLPPFIVSKYRGAANHNQRFTIFAGDFGSVRPHLKMPPQQFKRFKLVGKFYHPCGAGVTIFGSFPVNVHPGHNPADFLRHVVYVEKIAVGIENPAGSRKAVSASSYNSIPEWEVPRPTAQGSGVRCGWSRLHL